MKQPIEVSLAVLLIAAAGAIFWRQAHAPKPDPCVSKCLAVAKDLKCKRGDKCAELCGKLETATVCKPYVDRFIACFTEAPSVTWYCEDDGTPMLGHMCEPEQNNISDCMTHNGGKL
jgi:hypothetical protein